MVSRLNSLVFQASESSSPISGQQFAPLGIGKPS
jgi:hypothetical protein